MRGPNAAAASLTVRRSSALSPVDGRRVRGYRRTPQNSSWTSRLSSEQGDNPAAPRVHRQSIQDHRHKDGAPVSFACSHQDPRRGVNGNRKLIRCRQSKIDQLKLVNFQLPRSGQYSVAADRRRCAPLGAGRCLLGSGSALGWIIDRVTTDKASGIDQDPNDWCEEHEIPPTSSIASERSYRGLARGQSG